MKQSKRKQRSRAAKRQDGKGGVAAIPKEKEVQRKDVVTSLNVQFSSVSVGEPLLPLSERKEGDPEKDLAVADDQASCCSSSNGSSSCSSGNRSCLGSSQILSSHGRSKKKIIASSGTVSSVLGKQYIASNSRTGDSSKSKWSRKTGSSREEYEQFLCSMLGDESDLGMAVVRDVLCQCGYDLDEALNALLELSTSSHDMSKFDDSHYLTTKPDDDIHFHLEGSDHLHDMASDSTSHSSENEIQENVWFWGKPRRNYSEVLTDANKSMYPIQHKTTDVPKMVLESLFHMPKSSEYEPNPMNWKDVVKKMESLGQNIAAEPVVSAGQQQNNYESVVKEDDYHMFRKSAKEQWDAMKSCFQKAATAFSNGDRQYAAYLSDQGRFHNKMAKKADEKAGQQIFDSRNKKNENVITIDLHGQHVKNAMRMLKVHLLFGAYVRSVQTFRVITGCGNHGVGKSKLKQSVVNLVKREGIEWHEENQGTVVIRLKGQTEFSFMESECDSSDE